MKTKKALVLLMAGTMMIFSLVACGGGTDKSSSSDNVSTDMTEEKKEELETVTFVHGYYHDASEWAAAGEMRAIYNEFAEAHKDEYNFVVKADEGGAEGIYHTAINSIGAGEFYDIADFGGWDITGVASAADMILDLKPYLDEDADFKAGVGVCYDQNLTEDGAIYSVREQIEGVGFWYNTDLFEQAGAAVPSEWKNWADFETAVDKLVEAGITPFGLNAGWPTNILTAAYLQRNEESRVFYAEGKEAASMDTVVFQDTLSFIQKNLQKIDAANFGPGGDDDEQYRTDFFDGKTAMLFNGVWDAGGSVDCGAGAENIKPAVFPTDEDGKTAALLSGGCGYVVSNKLSETQTKACIDFIKYMTSKEVAERIIKAGIGMAPSSAVDYDAIYSEVETDDAKLLVEACKLCQSADYKALGLGNNFGDLEGEIQNKYAQLKNGSSVEDAIKELDNFIEAAE